MANEHNDTPCTITFTTDIGANVQVQTTISEVHGVQRTMGRAGWTSVTIPPGGLQLPYDLEEDFDWSLIGARKVVFDDGDVRVNYRGEWYTRRELGEVAPTRKLPRGMPAAVKYSRGAKAYDDPAMVETAEGEIHMVPLAIFRGNGAQFKGHLALPEKRSKYGRRS